MPIRVLPGIVLGAVSDFANVHKRLVPGFVTDLRMEGNARIVTFANGVTVKEALVTNDQRARRLVYAVVGGQLTHHSASVEVRPDGTEGSLVVWTTDFLPDSFADYLEKQMDAAAAVMKAHLESQRRRSGMHAACGAGGYDLRMPLNSRLLASGTGWQVKDVVCDYGPGDRTFEEQHQTACLAIVCEGTFSYRSHQGAALLVPGSVLLGNTAACFECGHEHSRGHRCLSFHLSSEFMEEIATQIPGVRTACFDVPRLPPLQSLMPVLAAAEIARDDGDTAQLEEIAVHLAAEALKGQSTCDRSCTPSSRDFRRVSAAVHWIEAHEQDSPTLSELARVVSMSRYHFLRTFRTVTGTTPYQYLLARRLRRASADLGRSSSPISHVAYNAGFHDLSTFNRRFRRVAKTTPREYRPSIL